MTFLFSTFILFAVLSRFSDSEQIFDLTSNTYTSHDFFRKESCSLIFVISCDVSKFPDDKDFRNIGVCMSRIAFQRVLSKSLYSSFKGFKISLPEVSG